MGKLPRNALELSIKRLNRVSTSSLSAGQKFSAIHTTFVGNVSGPVYTFKVRFCTLTKGSRTSSEYIGFTGIQGLNLMYKSCIMKTYSIKKLKAFTLTELMVVLVIIGILMLISLPIVMPLIAKTHSLEAKRQLTHIRDLEKSHYQFNFKYSDDFREIGFEAPKNITQDGGTAKYAYEIVNASPHGFLARATAVVDFNGNGTYNQWEIDSDGQPREVVPD